MKKFILIALCASLVACKKEINSTNTTVVDNYIYEVNPQEIYQSNADKDKQKTSNQYISILYSNLFQTAIPLQEITDLSQIRLAIGDKQIADELILNGFANAPNIQIPSNSQMRADVELFIEQTYLRFYLRKPTAYENLQLKQLINEDPDLTPQHIYQSFALSNEYKYY
jgi:hypothetical protein